MRYCEKTTNAGIGDATPDHFGQIAAKQITHALIRHFTSLFIDPKTAEAFSKHCKGITMPTVQAFFLDQLQEEASRQVSRMNPKIDRSTIEKNAVINQALYLHRFQTIILPCLP